MKIKLKEITFEIDGRLILVRRARKNIFEVWDVARDSRLFTLDWKKISAFGWDIRKCVNIEDSDLLMVFIVNGVKDGHVRKFKNAQAILDCQEFYDLCFDDNLNWMGAAVESLEN